MGKRGTKPVNQGELAFWEKEWYRFFQGLVEGFKAVHLEEPDLTPRKLPSHPILLRELPHRYDHYNCGGVAAWDDPAQTEKCIGWARQCWEAMQSFYERSAYVNDLGEEGEQRVREAYGPNYDSLGGAEEQIRPDKFFPP